MITRPKEVINKSSAFLIGAIIAACPLAMSDPLISVIDRSLEACSSDLKEDATGWQRLQLVMASRDDWVEMCAEQIQSDLKAAADRDYESGILTDQRFRRQRDEIEKHLSNRKASEVAGIKYNDPLIKEFIVVDGEVAGERTVEALPGYKTVSK